MQIGGIEIMPGAALAPMAGVTDAPMRTLCAEYGAGFTVSEMVSAKALCMKDVKSRRLLKGRGANVPYGVQLFGHEPETIAAAIQWIEQEDFDFIDLNMGCPAPKITSTGAGSALLKNPALAGEIAKAAVKASSRPVTVKLRIGWDENTLTGLEVAQRCEQAGICMLAVHGRTQKEMYFPGVHQDKVAEIKQNVGIPVLFNGDVSTGAQAVLALQNTGCDGIMLGRAAMGSPWVFAEIKAALLGQPPLPSVSLGEKMRVLNRQVQEMCEQKGEEVAMRQARGVAAQYMKGLNGAAELRRRAYALTYYTDLDALINDAFFMQEKGR